MHDSAMCVCLLLCGPLCATVYTYMRVCIFESYQERLCVCIHIHICFMHIYGFSANGHVSRSCTYICIHIYIYIHMYIHTHVHTSTHTHTQIGDMISLEEINLDNNKLSEIPFTIAALPQVNHGTQHALHACVLFLCVWITSVCQKCIRTDHSTNEIAHIRMCTYLTTLQIHVCAILMTSKIAFHEVDLEHDIHMCACILGRLSLEL